MMMVAPVPMRVAVIAPMIISPMVAVVSPTYHNHGRRSDHDGRRDAETDGDVDASLGRLRLREQGESQQGDLTPHAYDMCETFHGHILTV